MVFDKTGCPHCRAKLEVRVGFPLRFCRCPKCGNDFAMCNDRTFEFPYEYSETHVVDLEAERAQERLRMKDEMEDSLERDRQRYIDKINASIRLGVASMTPQQKAEAIRDMEITGSYWNLDTGEPYKKRNW